MNAGSLGKWKRVLEKLEGLEELAWAAAPSLILLKRDAWIYTPPLLWAGAIPVATSLKKAWAVQFSYRCLWRRPNLMELIQYFKGDQDWALRANNWFQAHEDWWGIDDVELVTVTLGRNNDGEIKPGDFKFWWVKFRTGATPWGVVERILRGDFAHLGGELVVASPKTGLKLVSHGEAKLSPLLRAENDHHSFKLTQASKGIVQPNIQLISRGLMTHFKVFEKKRGHLPWEGDWR